MGLKEQIEVWPDAMRTAVVRAAEAEAALAQIDLDLSAAEMFSRVGVDTLTASSRPQPGSNTHLSKEDAARRDELLQQKVEAEEATWEAQYNIGRAKAAVDVQIRRDAEAAGKKLTETAIRARVQIHPDVEAAERRLHEAERLVGAVRGRLYALEEVMPELGINLDGFSDDDDDVSAKAAQEAAARSRIRELQQKRVSRIRELELARAEVAYQRAIGKALGMLAKLAAAEIAAGH